MYALAWYASAHNGVVHDHLWRVEQEQGVVVVVQLGPDVRGLRLLWFANQLRRRLWSRRTCFLGAP